MTDENRSSSEASGSENTTGWMGGLLSLGDNFLLRRSGPDKLYNNDPQIEEESLRELQSQVAHLKLQMLEKDRQIESEKSDHETWKNLLGKLAITTGVRAACLT
jgi:hypothetical protein